ncbi:MAG: RNA polymerase sigma factor, partial [Bacteroidota bacterium]
QQRLYHHIRRMVTDHDDTDDILQNVFIKVWKNIDRFRGDSELFTWLYRIASNESLTFLKQKQRRQSVSLQDMEDKLPGGTAGPNQLSGEAIQRLLQQAIATLPPKQRLVFTMKYYDDLKYEEISQALDTSVGALKASFHHAVKKIEHFITHR